MQFYYAMTILKKFAEYKGDTDYIAYLEEKQKQQGDVINEFCWNEDRFIRGIYRGRRDNRKENGQRGKYVAESAELERDQWACDRRADRKKQWKMFMRS